jgi:CRP/FNR family transcriptional regulator, cyclic AMP receptor protein
MIKPTELLLKVAPRIPLFYGLGIGILEDLVKCGALLNLTKGEKFFDEGDEADSFFVLLHGEASVEKSLKKKFYPIARLASGDCIGEMTIINPGKRSARVTALEDCLVFKVYVFKLKMFPGLTSELYLNIARILEQRLRKNNTELASLTAKVEELEKQEEIGEVEAGSQPKDEGVNEPDAIATIAAHDSHNELFMQKEGDLKKVLPIDE